MIRTATVADLPDLPGIERAAGELFRPIGMDAIADDEPPTVAELLTYVEHGHAWVVLRNEQVAGYLIADLVDGAAHIEQVTIHPQHSGHRLGAA